MSPAVESKGKGPAEKTALTARTKVGRCARVRAGPPCRSSPQGHGTGAPAGAGRGQPAAGRGTWVLWIKVGLGEGDTVSLRAWKPSGTSGAAESPSEGRVHGGGLT